MQKGEALVTYQQEWQEEKALIERHSSTNLGILNPVPLPLVKKTGKNRRRGYRLVYLSRTNINPLCLFLCIFHPSCSPCCGDNGG